MESCKLYYIELTKDINRNNVIQEFKKIYEHSLVNQIYITTNLEEYSLYSCWSLEDSYFVLGESRYLLRVPHSYSPNDVAGDLRKFSPIVLSLSTNPDDYPPFGFKFSNIDKDGINKFWLDTCRYRDMNESSFFHISSKEELIKIVKDNNINLWGFDNNFLDKVEERFLHGFDPNANEVIAEEFLTIFGLASIDVRDIFRF